MALILVRPILRRRTRSACDRHARTWTTGRSHGATTRWISLWGSRSSRSSRPFLLHLLDQGLARKTVSRHRDNLWVLGGELIRRRYEDDELAGLDVKDALQQFIDSDGGPLICPRISESEQDSLNATCRKLHRFMLGG